MPLLAVAMASCPAFLFLGLFPCHWEPQHKGPAAGTYFWCEGEGEAPMETQVMLDTKLAHSPSGILAALLNRSEQS